MADMCTISVHIIATGLAPATYEPMSATKEPIYDPASVRKLAGIKLFDPTW